MMNKSIRILLVDDHTILREGIATILAGAEGIEVVGGLSSGEDAVNNFGSYSPDIILMDVMMKGMTGLEATRWIKEQDSRIKIIIISSEIKKEFVSLGIKCGIDGYLSKDIHQATLLEAIREVMQGKKYFNAVVTNLVFEDFYSTEKNGKKPRRQLTEGLTARESEVLELIASGKTNSEVAEALFISVKTVETHKANILGKLGLKNMAELVKYAIKNNIIPLD